MALCRLLSTLRLSLRGVSPDLHWRARWRRRTAYRRPSRRTLGIIVSADCYRNREYCKGVIRLSLCFWTSKFPFGVSECTSPVTRGPRSSEHALHRSCPKSQASLLPGADVLPLGRMRRAREKGFVRRREGFQGEQARNRPLLGYGSAHPQPSTSRGSTGFVSSRANTLKTSRKQSWRRCLRGGCAFFK